MQDALARDTRTRRVSVRLTVTLTGGVLCLTAFTNRTRLYISLAITCVSAQNQLLSALVAE